MHVLAFWLKMAYEFLMHSTSAFFEHFRGPWMTHAYGVTGSLFTTLMMNTFLSFPPPHLTYTRRLCYLGSGFGRVLMRPRLGGFYGIT